MPTDNGYDASCHFSWGDVMVDDPLRPSRLGVHIKASKIDPFCQGISLFISRVTSDLCPVSAMLAYMVVGARKQAPFSDLAMVGY